MEDNSKNILRDAEKLYYLGDYLKSLDLLTELQEKKEISQGIQCSISILKSKIFNALGEYTKEIQSLELADKISQEIKDISILFDVIILKAEKAVEKGEKKNFFELIGKAEKLFEENKMELLPKAGDISLSKGHYYSMMEVDYTQALKFYNEGLKIYKKNNDMQNIAEILIDIGGVMFYKGELDKSMLYYEESLIICEKFGYKRGIAEIYNGFGILFSYTEDFFKSLNYMEKSLAVAKEIKYKIVIAASLVNIGEMFYDQGDLKKTGEYYERSLNEYRELQNIPGIGYVLLDLIMLYIELDYNEKLEENFSHLKDLHNKYHFLFKEVVHYFHLAEALILKKSSRMHDKVKAEQIFKEYAGEDHVDFQLSFIALLNWCELLLYELSISNEPEVLDEIQEIIDKLLHLEEQQYNYK